MLCYSYIVKFVRIGELLKYCSKKHKRQFCKKKQMLEIIFQSSFYDDIHCRPER